MLFSSPVFVYREKNKTDFVHFEYIFCRGIFIGVKYKKVTKVLLSCCLLLSETKDINTHNISIYSKDMIIFYL